MAIVIEEKSGEVIPAAPVPAGEEGGHLPSRLAALT